MKKYELQIGLKGTDYCLYINDEAIILFDEKGNTKAPRTDADKREAAIRNWIEGGLVIKDYVFNPYANGKIVTFKKDKDCENPILYFINSKTQKYTKILEVTSKNLAELSGIVTIKNNKQTIMEKRKNIIVKEIVKMQEGEVDVTYISSFNAYGGAASINPKHPKFNELVFVFRADNELLTNRYKAGFTEVNSGTIKNKTYIHEETDLPVTVHCTNRFKTLANVGMIISEDENGKYITKFYGSELQDFKDLDLEITIAKKNDSKQIN